MKATLPIWVLLMGAHAWGAGPLFNVLDYGARNDGGAPSTEAIRSAIQAAKAAGGGTVYIPAGKYITGPIELVSNLVLHVEAGATVQFPAERLPYTKGRTQGIETIGPVPLIGGHDLENVSITGRGVITTDNAEWTRLMGGPTPRSDSGPGSAFGPDWNRLLELVQQKTPQPDFIHTDDGKQEHTDRRHSHDRRALLECPLAVFAKRRDSRRHPGDLPGGIHRRNLYRLQPRCADFWLLSG